MSRNIITSVKVEFGPTHDRVHVWNRGGKAGVLTVAHGDGARIAEMLGGKKHEVQPKSMGFCHKCKQHVAYGDETWGFVDSEGEWVLSLDGYLHHKGCVR
jgi:hypothetical protein